MTNRLDRMIAQVAPLWAYRRARARQALAFHEQLEGGGVGRRRFDGADRGRRTQGWITLNTSANTEARGSLSHLRSRCRDLRRNNPYAKSAIQKLRANIVGKGVRPKFRHESDAVLKRARQLWADWAHSEQCDADGRQNFAGMQAAVMESAIEGGEALVRRRRRRLSDGLAVPIQLQALEGDFIDSTKDGFLAQDGGNKTLQGIEFDRLGRRTGYWIYSDHPGDAVIPIDQSSRFIRSDDIRHVYRMDRLGQVRGISWAAPVIMRLHDFDNYEDNEALRMVVATSYSAFVHDLTADGLFDDGVPPTSSTPGAENKNPKGQPIDELEPGTIEFLPPGKSIKFTTPPQNEGFANYAAVQLRSIARGFGVPYELLTGDLERVNFSTGRLSFIDFQRDVEDWRDFILILHFCQPTLSWWRDQAELAGVLPSGLEWSWMPPRREMVDPRTEINAEIASVRAGFKSLSQVVEGMGQDLETVLDQLEGDLKLARDRGLILSVDNELAAGPTNENVNGNGGGGDRSADLWQRLENILVEATELRNESELELELTDILERRSSRMPLENGAT